ncbi:MAG: glutamate-5-semialdehyde dehydrogenase [Elusimicrobiota bacterium]|jgi:glutamate-5-semialdehyde dehydrogenase
MTSLSPIAERVTRQALLAKAASRRLMLLAADDKKRALESMAEALTAASKDILFHNEIDVEAATQAGLNSALIDRLKLTPESVEGMAQSLREIAGQADPVGEILETWKRPSGIQIEKVRVPLGVLAMIYESRPNVTVEAAALCLKSGNAVLLRGGSEAINSNRALVHVLIKAAQAAKIPDGAIQLLEDTNRESIMELIRLNQLVDLVIARGSEEMIQHVMKNASVPVLGHGKGVCHVYVDENADLAMAERIAFNAKVQRPGVCNAMETLLVHRKVAGQFLPAIARAYEAAKVEIRGDPMTCQQIPSAMPATEEDWRTEYLDLIVSIRVVDSLDQAIEHIHRYGSGHSDAIVTENADHARQFLGTVDSAAVMHNVSTRLHDGGVFGLGAEIGISTRKLHARGTMGARELTTTKYIVRGTGQIRE